MQQMPAAAAAADVVAGCCPGCRSRMTDQVALQGLDVESRLKKKKHGAHLVCMVQLRLAGIHSYHLQIRAGSESAGMRECSCGEA